MQILTKEEFLSTKEDLIKLIKSGAVFIYPTDTIYGIGCNAKIDDAVKKIRILKQRPKNPFSIIAPSKEWITQNCILDNSYLDKLPGPYTFICRLKNKIVSDFVNPRLDTIGVRIPDSWFTQIIEEASVPFITTSVNITGEPYMQNLNKLDDYIKEGIDYIIDVGPLNGKPSTIIDFTKDKIEIKERW